MAGHTGLGSVRTAPRYLEAVRSLLTAAQANNFDRRYRGVSQSGEPHLFLISWQREFGGEALVILAERRGDDISAEAIEVAPTDMQYPKLRAGPDAGSLHQKRVVVFGLGAVGSHLAYRLAEAGLGFMRLIDDDTLRPSNVIRHALGRWAIGSQKAIAARGNLETRAPWTRVEAVAESPWDPQRIRELVADADCVVDTTGLTSFANMMSLLCAQGPTPLCWQRSTLADRSRE